jgi:putative restriction endonuclease
MKSAIEVLDAFDRIRRAQRAGVYAPHKPLLILRARARVQRGEPRLVAFTEIDALLKRLPTAFGPSGAGTSRHGPFRHLATHGNGALWELSGPREVLKRPAAATPGLSELCTHHVEGGFPADIDGALRHVPGLLQAVASRVLVAYFPSTLQTDIVATLGLDRDGPRGAREAMPLAATDENAQRQHREVFSQHAIRGGRGIAGGLQFHGRPIHAPQHVDLLPAPEFLAWNVKNVFMSPAREVSAAARGAGR